MLYSSVYLCVLALFETVLHIQAFCNKPLLYCGDVPIENHVYYDQCAYPVRCKQNMMYRQYNGRCNNLEHPLWGSTNTPYVRLLRGVYSDDDHAFRLQTNGSKLPGPREVRLSLFSEKMETDNPDVHNFHLTQFGQWLTHDISMLKADDTASKSCCEDSKPHQCREVIKISADDPVYSKIDQTCMEFKRAMTSTLNYNCRISPQIPINHVTAFIDASQLYGTTPTKASSLRSYVNGRLKTVKINDQEFNPLLKRKGTTCAGRNDVDICFDGGDPRLNQHFGLTLYHTMFTKFHNYVADLLKQVLPEANDNKLYQETRRIVGAVNQIIVYRDYLPIILGKKYTKKVGLNILKNQRTIYQKFLMPQVSIEFVASAFRVPHNMLPQKYNFMDKNYNLLSSVFITEWISIPDPIVQKSNFDNLLRGMTQTPSRAPTSSYNYMLSNFLFRYMSTGNQDLLAVDIQRGRDAGVPTYNKMRELCGLGKAKTFDKLKDIISMPDISALKELYASVNDVDLLVGALLEPPCKGAIVGPTARCIISDVFYRLKYGDRYFFNVRDQPGSFSSDQLDALSVIDLGHVFCAGSGIAEVPIEIYGTKKTRYSGMRNCKKHLESLDFTAWSNMLMF